MGYTTASFGGKSDNAQIPTFLLKVSQEKFSAEKMASQFGTEQTEVCLYGEGYGAKIQKGGGNYLPDSTDFILFDCKIKNLWLNRISVEEIADGLGIAVVPIIGWGTLLQAIEYVRNGYKSTISLNKDFDAEGLIVKPKIELLDRQGRRILSKIKFKDFAPYTP